jgi:hypothetical protein
MKTFIINKHFRQVRCLLGWILTNVETRDVRKFALVEFDPLLASLSKVFADRGLKGGLTFVKSVRGNYLNFLSGNSERFPGVKLTNRGVPVCFGPLLRFFDGSEIPVLVLRLLNTVLFSTRSLKTKASPDLGPITNPSKRGNFSYGVSRLVRDF